jgi:hypothetical protein
MCTFSSPKQFHIVFLQIFIQKNTRVKLPIINCFFKFSSYVLHFERFEMLWEHYFKLVQMKTSNEQITIRKISFSTRKTCFFLFFSSLDLSYFQSF